MSAPSAPPAPPTPGAAARPPARHGVGRPSDMVRSMLVVLAMVLVVVALVPRASGEEVRAVDVAQAAREAAVGLGDAPLVATGLPDGWVATSARTQRTAGLPTWFTGWSIDAERYVELQQAVGAPDAFLPVATREGAPAGRSTVAGESWTRTLGRAGQQDHRALWRRTGDTTVVVGGTASWAELEALAGALAPRQD